MNEQEQGGQPESILRLVIQYGREYICGVLISSEPLCSVCSGKGDTFCNIAERAIAANLSDCSHRGYLYVAESAREICDGLRRKISIQRRTFSVTWRSSAFLNDLDSDAICKTIVRLLCQNLTVAIKVIERLRETRIFASAASKNSENCLHIAK